MNNVTIEQVIEKVVRIGEENNFYRIQIGDDFEETVWVEDFNKLKTAGEVVKFCVEQLPGDDAYFVVERMNSYGRFFYQGEEYKPFEMSVILSDGSEDNYFDIDEVKEALECNFKDKFGNAIKLNAAVVDTERGFTMDVDWTKMNESDKEYLLSRGFTSDAETNTDLLIKEMVCEVKLIHNLCEL